MRIAVAPSPITAPADAIVGTAPTAVTRDSLGHSNVLFDRRPFGRRDAIDLFSAGIAARLPGECAADLLQRADAAMYLAKGAGRNRTVIAQASSPAADVRDPRPV